MVGSSSLQSYTRAPGRKNSDEQRQMFSLTSKTDEPLGRALREIPYPDVPVGPILSFASMATNAKSTTPAMTDIGRIHYAPAGRVAIAIALRELGISEGDEVLVPAFHCLSMIEPIYWLGAKPVFFQIKDDLSVDLDDIALKTRRQTKVLLAANYFGFPQDLVEIRQYCDDHNLSFIEDCAHSFFGAIDGKPLGSFGDYAIGSLTKFFPVSEGGCLVLNRHQGADLKLKSQGVLNNAKNLLQIIELASYYGRLPWLGLALRQISKIRQWAKTRRDNKQERLDDPPGQHPARQNSGVGLETDWAWIDRKATMTTRLISGLVSSRHIVERRRHNYLRLVQGFRQLPGVRLIASDLPDGVVPFMFPIWVDNLRTVFPRLEDGAIPMQRFGQFLDPSVNEALCKNSVLFSRHLLQLPCHQDLWDSEIDWIIDSFTMALAKVPETVTNQDCVISL